MNGSKAFLDEDLRKGLLVDIKLPNEASDL
jgi:hypothetical protein